jgi:anthranilate phosphoribosyltransferase
MPRLEEAATALRRIAYGDTLSTEEIRHAMSIINEFDTITDPEHSDGLYFLGLTFGLMAKSPSAEELLGLVQHISENSVHLSTSVPPERLIDVSGTGGDKVKTYNVGTTASIIIAAAGGYVAKQATRGYTGFTGSADLYQTLGVDPFRAGSNDVVKCLERIGVTAFYTPAMSVGFKNRVDFLTKLRNIGLTYPTPWHLISWVYSPFKMAARIYGVYDAKYMEAIAGLFAQLGYSRAMVVHGEIGLDEISSVGRTQIIEIDDGVMRSYTFSPEDVGMSQAHVAEISSLSESDLLALSDDATSDDTKADIRRDARDRNIADFYRILYDREHGPKLDLALLNAGAGLYLCKLAEDMSSGVELARQAIESGATRKKLRELTEFAGIPAMLQEQEKRLGL